MSSGCRDGAWVVVREVGVARLDAKQESSIDLLVMIMLLPWSPPSLQQRPPAAVVTRIGLAPRTLLYARGGIYTVTGKSKLKQHVSIAGRHERRAVLASSSILRRCGKRFRAENGTWTNRDLLGCEDPVSQRVDGRETDESARRRGGFGVRSAAQARGFVQETGI